MKTQSKIDILKHAFVPKHVKMTEEEVQELLLKYNISHKQLPIIRKSDPAIKELGVNAGDVIKITRKSPTADEYVFYRVVVSG